VRIVQVDISNFRGIKQLFWNPSDGANCLIGPGDSGKTSVLDAIELAFAARSGVTFDDTDFYDVSPKSNPISIMVTISDLPADFLKEDRYATYLRGWDQAGKRLEDEPDEGRLEYALSIRLTVDHSLEGEWSLYNLRVDQGTQHPRNLAFQDRQDIAPSRLGPYADRHLSWSRHSILNRITKGSAGSRGLMAEAGRVARQEFSKDSKTLFADTIAQAKLAAKRLGVSVSDDLQAMLDVQAVGLSGGGISLHDGDLPLRRLGIGSARLFIAALQDHARTNASVALIDEVEHGLEPHRISRLLRQLKEPKSGTATKAQVFMTTHSPVVLQELGVGELNVVRRKPSTGVVTICSANQVFKELDAQSQPRANPQAYLAPSILVCEGKTEVGLVRGLDDFWVENGQLPFSTAGVVAISGNGIDQAPVVAGYFSLLGYSVGLLLDGDCEPKDTNILGEIKQAGVTVIRWAPGHATEDHLFRDLPRNAVESLIRAAAAFQDSEQSFLDSLRQKYTKARFATVDAVAGAADDPALRAALGELTKTRKQGDSRERGWFKDIGRAEWVGRKHVGPHLNQIRGRFPEAIAEIRAWVDRGE
jgi:putative ATP-dependent endonuclease of the OLD family